MRPTPASRPRRLFLALHLGAIAARCRAQTGLPPSTAAALGDLWAATGGAGWTRCRGWRPPLDPCTRPWGRPEWSPPTDDDVADPWGDDVCFVCNGTALEGIALGSTNLTGALPASLGNLTALTYLGLSNNSITAIPDGAFTGLTALGTL